MPSRTIYWVEDSQKWFTSGPNPIVVQPAIGDMIDVLACDRMWVVALNRRDLSFLAVAGSDELVQVVARDHIIKQSKIVMRGFQKPKRRW